MTYPHAAEPPEVCLFVYNGGARRMVGKVFRRGATGVFLHEAAGAQFHAKNNSPGGLDVAAARWLRDHGVSVVEHYDRPSGTVLSAPLEKFLAPTTPVQRIGGRRPRAFLPISEWAQRHEPNYKSPWISAEIDIP